MADAKRISATITVPAGVEHEAVNHELTNALRLAGVSVVTLGVTRIGSTTLQMYGDALVPTGQANATTITAITNTINGLSLAGVALSASAVTCLNSSPQTTAPFPDNTFSATKGGNGRPPW